MEGRKELQETLSKQATTLDKATKTQSSLDMWRRTAENMKFDEAVDNRIAAGNPTFRVYLAEYRSGWKNVSANSQFPKTNSAPLAHIAYLGQERDLFWNSQMSKLDVRLSDPSLAAACDLGQGGAQPNRATSNLATLEVHMEIQCGLPGASEPVPLKQVPHPVCFDRKAAVDQNDVKLAELQHIMQGPPSIRFYLNETAGMRLYELTSPSIGRYMQIVVNKRAETPRIVGGSLQVYFEGGLTEAQARALVQQFNNQSRR
jgi:hypothetical protein